jgi:ribulose-5-phosphate 4-epimerase/fuculose-1-phosphate aldolase
MTEIEKLRDRTYRHQVATACRAIAASGYGDVTMGHVSIFDRDRGLMYIKRKGLGLDEIEWTDVLVHPIEDDDALHTTPMMHFEASMHTEVYKARDDVNSVIHSHPPYAIAMGATEASLQMVNHDAVMFAEHGVPAIDDHDLITTSEQGARVAKALGPARALLLRGHGVLIAGEDVRWSVRAAVCLERAIKVQMYASMLGPLRPIPADVAKDFFKRKYTAKKFLTIADEDKSSDGTSLDEFWDYWERSTRRNDTVVPRQV